MTKERATELAKRMVLEVSKDGPNPYPAKWDQLIALVAETVIKAYGDGVVAQKDTDAKIVRLHPSTHQCAMQDTCADQLAELIRLSNVRDTVTMPPPNPPGSLGSGL